MKFNFNKLVLLVACLFLFLAFNFSNADDSLVSDAIAIRILPNTEHLSIDTWYKSRGFSGSPQSLIVDGYEAIRDGRTVYVAAANIDETDIYTNIYLISYNQESASPTLDTLGQIISHWKFNRNVSNNSVSKCSISNMTCLEDSDCPSGLVCGNGDDNNFAFQLNKCVVEETETSLPNTKNCLTDMDCPKGLFCTSDKAKITRDVIRVGRLTDFTTYLELYKYQHGSYPTLSAGSYVQNLTFSTWPSWNNVLAPALGFGSEMVDPINAFGSCEPLNYNPQTCWNEKEYKFIDNNLNDGIKFPANSFVYAYNSKSDGSEYNLCATIETASSTPSYQFKGAELNNSTFCQGEVSYGASFTPEPISLLGYNLNGQSGLPFFGTIEISNPDGKILTWSINTSTDFSSWDEVPYLQNNLNPNKKNIVSSKAGDKDSYTFTLDILNNSATTTIHNKEFTINISDEAPQIQAQNINYNFDGVTPLDYSVNLFDNNFDVNDSGKLQAYTLKVNYPSDFPNNTYTLVPGDTFLDHGLELDVEKMASNHYRFNIKGLLGDLDGDGVLGPGDETAHGLKLDDPTNPDIIEFNLSISDSSSNTSTKDFSINILNNAPIFNFSCPEEIRAGTSDMGGEAFECFINLENPDEGTVIDFSTKYLNRYNNGSFLDHTDTNSFGLPLNINWNASSSFLSGFVDYDSHVKYDADYKLADRDYAVLKISPKATNSSGVYSETFFDLKVNSFCGDGYLNKPNGELAGGPFGDGYEECDGFSGTVCSAAGVCDLEKSYSEDKSYACTTNEVTSKPVQPGTCSYTGGRCGDSLLQPEYGEECDFGNNNSCCKFCKWDLDSGTSTPVYFTTEEGSLDYLEDITLANNETGYIAMPDVKMFSTSSGDILIDIIAKRKKIFENTSIVFITSRAHTVASNKLDDIKKALIGTTDSSATKAKKGSVMYKLKGMSDPSYPDKIRVGLVSFYTQNLNPSTSPSIKFKNIVSLTADTDYEDLVSEIAGYTSAPGGSPVKAALQKTHQMMENEASGRNKLYILLNDGSDFNIDPLDYINTTIRNSSDYQNNKISMHSIYLSSFPFNENRLEKMCLWSNDGDDSSYNCEDSCNQIGGCSGAKYTYLENNDLAHIYNGMAENLKKDAETNALDIMINGASSTRLLLIAGQDNYTDQELIFNGVTCDFKNTKCTPDYIPFKGIFDSLGDSINFSNLSLKTLKSCE